MARMAKARTSFRIKAVSLKYRLFIKTLLSMVYMSRRYLASEYNVFLNTLLEMWLSSFKCQCLSGVHRGLVRSSTPLLEQCFVTGGEDGLLCLWRAEAKANPSGAVKVRPSTGPQIKRSRVT